MLYEVITNALRAHNLYERDTEYVVENGEVIIVDEFTGRTMPGRRWSDGLHQAVEAKEGVKIVITSYSIHYTKLYDAAHTDPARGRDQDQVRVITSYSIHYTKLYESRSGPVHLLVLGGSLGAQALNRTLPAALALLPRNNFV